MSIRVAVSDQTEGTALGIKRFCELLSIGAPPQAVVTGLMGIHAQQKSYSEALRAIAESTREATGGSSSDLQERLSKKLKEQIPDLEAAAGVS